MDENENSSTDNIQSNNAASADRSKGSQRLGTAIDAEASAVLSTEKTAIVFFELVRNRLEHVNSWPVIAGNLSAEFQIVNKEGLEVFRKAHEGDYLRIDITAPGVRPGSGFDWVRIEYLDDMDQHRFGFCMRPATHPGSHRHAGARFYHVDSTSSFVVFRAGRRVTVQISDRNLRPTGEEIKSVDTLRNDAFAWTARKRFSEIHWQALAEGLVSR